MSDHPKRNRRGSAGRARAARTRPALECLEARNLLTTYNVYSFGGSDAFGTGTAAAPFQTLQKAINAAATGDTIRLSGGVYTYDPSQDQTTKFFGVSAVGFVANKNLTIVGGYTPADGFANSSPATPTVIDGAGVRRGIVVTANAAGGAGLNLQNVTVQNGLGGPIAARNSLLGNGGGMLAELSTLSVANVTFQNNTAVGGNASSGTAGPGAGGGLGVFSASGTVTLSGLTFANNKAVGGTGPTGGFGQGGGLFTDLTNIDGTNLTFTGNQALGGASSAGSVAGSSADGFGGAANFESSSSAAVSVALSGVTATNNQALGGNAAAAGAAPGGGFGGGLGAENLTIAVTQAILRGNLAKGGLNGSGESNSARRGFGGGFQGTNSNVDLERVAITANRAEGGAGGSTSPAAGGGLSAYDSAGPRTLTLRNSLVADNVLAFGAGANEGASGSAGAGMDLFGTTAVVDASTFANNNFAGGTFNLQGQAISARNGAALTLTNSIVADHANSLAGAAAAVHIFTDATATFGKNLFAGNSRDSNANGLPNPNGSYVGFNAANILTPPSAKFLAPGASDYRPGDGSPAVGAAVNSDSAVDLNNFARSSPPSLGALEVGSPNPGGTGASTGVPVTPPPPPPPPPPSGTGDGGHAAPGAYTVGSFDPSSSTFYLRTSNSPGATTAGAAQFGLPGWLPLAGDWNGDGNTSIGVFDPSTATFYLRNENGPGAPDAGTFQYGAPGWVPLAGDWNGDGKVTVGVFNPATATFYLRNENSSGAPDAGAFQFGAPGWVPLAGDWNGDGKWSVGVFNPATATFYLRNENGSGAPDAGITQFGAAGWNPVVGKFNGKTWGLGAVDPSTGTWYLHYSLDPGAPSISAFPFGAGSWQPLSGHWAGNPQFGADGLAGGAAAVTPADLDAAVAVVLGRAARAGVSSNTLARLASATVTLGALPSGVLGLTDDGGVVIEPTGSGHGWFLPPTLSDPALLAQDNPPPGQYDLLTVVAHELGHVAGLPDQKDGNGLMAEVLPTGTSRLDALDAAFRGL